MGDTKTPADRSYRNETEKTLRSQLALAGDLYDNERKYQPKYAALQADIFEQQAPRYASVYEKQIMPAVGRAENSLSGQRVSGDISLANQYGSQLRDSNRALNPENTALLDEMNRQARLGLNESLTAEDRRDIEQGVRSGQSARGFGYGNADLIQEVMTRSQAGRDLQDRNRQFAGNVSQLNSANSVDPFAFVGSRRSDLSGAALGIGAQTFAGNASSGPKLFNPESGYASDIYNTNYNARASARIADANNEAALIGGMMSVMGGAASGAMCWVAREVYGIHNPRWIIFRHWMMNIAPQWFRSLYIENGEAFAEWIKNKPRLKRIIRWWMDARIKNMKGLHAI